MYYALLLGEPIDAFAFDQKLTRGEVSRRALTELTCPDCGRPVRFLKSAKKRPHFAHVGRGNTQTSESTWHKTNKEWIARHLTASGLPAETERPIATGERRADVFVTLPNTNRQATIELQASRIDAREVRQRMADYAAEGIAVVWLLSPAVAHYKWRPQHLSLLTPFLCTLGAHGCYLPYWQGSKQRVLLLFPDAYGRVARVAYQSIEGYLAHFDTARKSLTLATPTAPPKRALTPRARARRVAQILQAPTQAERDLLARLYRLTLSLADLPPQLLDYQTPCLFVREPLWIVLAYLFLLRQRYGNFTDKTNARLCRLLHLRPFTIDIRTALASWLGTLTPLLP